MAFNKVKNLRKKVKTKFNKLTSAVKTAFTKNLWISLGENCLTDNILQRHNLKSFSTPYSHGRSNIDYAIQLEHLKYLGLLDSANLKHESLDGKNVVRSTLINSCDDIYHQLQMNGFEFTHHDILKSVSAKKSLERKVGKLQRYKGSKNYVFFYHYRLNNNMSKDKVFEKVAQFSSFYKLNGHKCFMIVFTQNIINDDNRRGIYYSKVSDTVHFFELSTLHNWQGDNQDIFWARVDDDLIQKMIAATKKIILKGKEISEGWL